MTEPTSATSRRRRHSAAVKAQILAECERPGASIAAVAMAHGINANLLHKWRSQLMKRQEVVVSTPSPGFVALPLAANSAATQHPELRIELRRGSVTATVSWPMSDVTQCAAWLREVLR